MSAPSRLASPTAARASRLSPTSSSPGARAIAARSPAWTRGWSSTSSTRTVIGGVVLPAGRGMVFLRPASDPWISGPRPGRARSPGPCGRVAGAGRLSESTRRRVVAARRRETTHAQPHPLRHPARRAPRSRDTAAAQMAALVTRELRASRAPRGPRSDALRRAVAPVGRFRHIDHHSVRAGTAGRAPARPAVGPQTARSSRIATSGRAAKRKGTKVVPMPARDVHGRPVAAVHALAVAAAAGATAGTLPARVRDADLAAVQVAGEHEVEPPRLQRSKIAGSA